MKKRFIAILLTIVMVLGTGTMFAAAEGVEDEQGAPVVEKTEEQVDATIEETGDTAESEEAVTEETESRAEELKIISQPKDVSVSFGTNVTFSVKAIGADLNYQWETKLPDWIGWHDTVLPGSNTSSLSFKANAEYTKRQYRCVVTDKYGNSVTSKAATLTVSPLKAIATISKTGDAVVSLKTADSGQISYIIVRALKDGVVDPSVAEVKAESTSATVSGLSGVYSFEVEAFGEEKVTQVDPDTGEETVVETKIVSLGKAYTDEVFVAAITNFALYPSHKSIALEWGPVEGVSYYEVYRNGALRTKVMPDSRAYDNPDMMAYIDEGMAEQVSLAKYTYRVKAVLEDGDKVYVSAPSENLTGSCVQQMYVSIKFKAKTTLTSHEGSKKKHTFNKNEVVYAHGYLLGKHQFYYTINGKKYLFYTKYTRMKSPSAKYTTSFNYDEKSAEYYVNFHKNSDGSVGFFSNTRNLIWVNRYTQHIYVFEKVNGYWRLNETKATKGSSKKSSIIGKLYRDWECSTGKASSPSPTGSYKIYKRKSKYHGHKWWNFYHSETAIHGKVKGTVWGMPKSSGCIRNPDLNAEFIYYNTNKNTKVNVY